MSETLFIRLGSQEHDPIQWLIWSTHQREIIASGDLNHASELTHLTEKAQHRKVIGFVPGSDVVIKSLKVPGKSSRAITAATPYMLEDDLAQDVESLFFAYSQAVSDDKENNCFTVAVEHDQIQQWNAWLQNANITCKTLIPDVLAMPVITDQKTAIRVNDQILIRESQWRAMSVDSHVWPIIANMWESNDAEPQDDDGTTEESSYVESNQVVVNAYSPLPEVSSIQVNHMPEELPLALLAQHVNTQLINLLQGEYHVKEQRSSAHTSWLWVAGIAACALLVNVGLKGAQLIQLNNQVDALEANIISTYKKAFPETKRVRVSTIKSQLQRKLSDVGGASNQAGFLPMLNEIQPAFKQVSAMSPDSLKFDAKRQEIRIQASSDNYQSFDKFKIALEKSDFKVSQGAQNNLGDKVTGSFTISAKGGR